MSQKKILVPTKSIESWKELLADPELHWNEKHSAMEVAKSWEAKDDIPIEIYKALNKSEDLKNQELLLAIPEFHVPLPGGNRDSQNDVLTILSSEKGLCVAAVEAKYHEDFGSDYIGPWLKKASPDSGKQERLSYILDKIRFPESIDNSNMRYQFFHRLASAVIMAEKFHAPQAIMIIQSFESDDKLNHYPDFVTFIEAYGKTAKKEQPIQLAKSENLTISAMWIYSGK